MFSYCKRYILSTSILPFGPGIVNLGAAGLKNKIMIAPPE